MKNKTLKIVTSKGEKMSSLKGFIKEADEQLNEMLKELDFRVKKIKTCLDEAEEIIK